MNTIQQVARQAAQDGFDYNIREKRVAVHFITDVADAVAVAVLREAEQYIDVRLSANNRSGGPVMIGLYEAQEIIQKLLAAFTPAEPPPQETSREAGRLAIEMCERIARGGWVSSELDTVREVLALADGNPAATQSSGNDRGSAAPSTNAQSDPSGAPQEPTQ